MYCNLVNSTLKKKGEESLTWIAGSMCCKDSNKYEEQGQYDRDQECRADSIDDFNPSKYDQAKHNSENNTIDLKVVYTWALQYFRYC